MNTAEFTRQAARLVERNDQVPAQRTGEAEIPKRLLDLAAHGVWVALNASIPRDYEICERIAAAALRPVVELVEAERRGVPYDASA